MRKPVDGDEILEAISAALRAGDVRAVPPLLGLLATIDPALAADTLETIKLGLKLAGRVHAALDGATS